MSATKSARRSTQLPPRTIVESTPTQMTSDPMQSSAPPREISADDIVGVLSSDDPHHVLVRLPVGELSTSGPKNNYRRRFLNIDCRLTDKGHIEGFQQLYYALNQQDTRLASGKHIETPADVLKHLIEQYTTALSGS